MQQQLPPPSKSMKKLKTVHNDRRVARQSSDTPFLVVDETGYISTENPRQAGQLSSFSDDGDPTAFSSCESEGIWQESSSTHASSSFDPGEIAVLDKSFSGSLGPPKQMMGKRKIYRKPTKAPFAMQTPCFSNETPIILATARHTGSTIHTSCNRESIKLIQNNVYGHSNTTSSAYFTNTTRSAMLPNSSTILTERCNDHSKILGNGRSDHSTVVDDNMVAADIGHVRSIDRTEESSIESQIYMAAVWQTGKLGVAYYDVDTTCIYAMLDKQENDSFRLLTQVIKQINPVQIVLSARQDERLIQAVKKQVAGETNESFTDGHTNFVKFLPSINFDVEVCKRRVISMDLASVPSHYTDNERILHMSSIVPFGNFCMVRALGGLLKFLEQTRIGIELEEAGTKLPVLDVKIFTLEEQMILDDTAYSALQIFHREFHPSVYKTGTSDSGKEGLSLFGIMNRTRSKVGSQMLRTWFQRPLKSFSVIKSRHDAVDFFSNPWNFELFSTLQDALKHIKNITRVLSRMKQSHISVGDWQALYKTVYSATCIKEICYMQPQTIQIFKKVVEKFTDDLKRVTKLIDMIVDFPESAQQGRFVVKPHVDENLDKLKRTFEGLPDFLSTAAQEELNKLGDDVSECTVLYMPQVGYLLAIPEAALANISDRNEGYYREGLEFVFSSNFVLHYRSEGTRGIEHTYIAAASAPVNVDPEFCARTSHNILPKPLAAFPQLDSLLGDTRCDITDMETTIMHKLQDSILEHTDVLLGLIDIAAELDCILSLAVCAREYGYVRPTMTEDNIIEVIGARHPIQEMCCGTFVPNDIYSDNETGKIKVLTGPNACGKSVYLKQVALIVFMAQIGSFVPATSARLGLIDRIFTRVSSLESISVGLSTFMIDINQMSDALRNAGKTSLCIVDEFGKGTDMIDGVALLVSSLKYWLNKADCPHVFVCTHFHSIIHQHLLPRTPQIKYMTLETLHNGDELVFLYQLVEGHTSSSYACHVAAQAGLPPEIVKRGAEVSELIRQCKPIQRIDTVGTDTQFKRCSAVVEKFMELELESTDMRKFLRDYVLPTMEG